MVNMGHYTEISNPFNGNVRKIETLFIDNVKLATAVRTVGAQTKRTVRRSNIVNCESWASLELENHFQKFKWILGVKRVYQFVGYEIAHIIQSIHRISQMKKVDFILIDICYILLRDTKFFFI